MNIIYDKARSGKTTKLIQMSHDNWIYIMAVDSRRAKHIAEMAKNLGIDIPYPVTLAEYLRTGFQGRYIKSKH